MNGHKKERIEMPSTRPMDETLIDSLDKYNPVMRIGAFTEGHSEKAALGRRYRHRVMSGQSEIPKVPGSHSKGPMLWGCHPPLPADRWIPMGIYVLQRHGPKRSDILMLTGHFADHARTTPSRHCPTVGARTDRPKRCTVNTAERASGLIRFTPAGFPCDVALTGGRTLPGIIT